MRRPRQLAVVLVATLLVAGSAAFVFGRDAGDGGQSIAETPPVSARGAPPDPTAAFVGALGPSFDPTLVGRPTAGPQARLWFNDGSWWGILAGGGGELHVHELDWSAQRWRDAGTLVDERADAIADAVWNGTALYVASGRTEKRERDAVRLRRFSYDSASRRYAIVPDFPIPLTEEGAPQLMLDEDGGGGLWFSWVSEGRLWLRRSPDGGLTWSTASALPAASGDVVEVGTLIATDAGVEVAWTSSSDEVRVSSHVLDDADDRWTTEGVPVPGTAGGRTELAMATVPAGGGDEEQLLVAVKTAPEDPDGNDLGPRVLVLQRVGDGAWQRHLAGRVADRHVGPALLVDGGERTVHLVATAPADGGTVFSKRSSLDDMSFPTGRGTPLIGLGDDAPAMRDVTTTKQDIGRSSGLVVLAADGTIGRYAHGAVSLGGDAVPAAQGPAVDTGEPVADELVHDRFDVWAPGTTLGNGWKTRSADVDAVATIEPVPSSEDLSARIGSGSTGAAMRACRELAPSEGTLTVAVDVLLGAAGRSDARLSSVRGGPELVSVRFDSRGTFSYVDGEGEVRTTVPYRLGTWYSSVVTVRTAEKVYDWELRERGAPAPLLSVSGAAWRSGDATAADEICLESPGGAPGSALHFDNVRVRR